MSKSSQKLTTGLAGEFLVTGELLRRGIMATVTYGNAKKADVIAINGTKAASLEVKSTSQTKWVLGSKLPAEDSNLWILVYLPEIETISPEYFVLTSTELRNLVLPQHETFNNRYRERHGKEFSGRGVVSVERKLLDDTHLGAWMKIRNALII